MQESENIDSRDVLGCLFNADNESKIGTKRTSIPSRKVSSRKFMPLSFEDDEGTGEGYFTLKEK